MKNKKTFIGIILIIVAIVGIFTWEAWGRTELTYDEVLVLNENIQKNEVITSAMVTVKKIPNKSQNSYGKEKLNQLLGMEAKQFVHKETELFPEYFDKNGLIAKDDEFILSIPNEWIKAFPQTLRRGDTAFLYAVSNEGTSSPKFVTSAKVAFSKDNTNNEVKSKDRDRLSGSGSVSLVEIIVNEKQADKITSSISGDSQFVIMYR